MQILNIRRWGRGVHGGGHKLVGSLLATLGFFWLAHRAGWIPVSDGGSVIFWPSVIIGLGLIILFGSGRGQTKGRG